MRSEGFWFTSGGLEVGVVFAQRCLGGRNRPQQSATVTVRNSSQGDRNEVAKPHHWVGLTKRDQDDVEVDFLADSVLLLLFDFL